LPEQEFHFSLKALAHTDLYPIRRALISLSDKQGLSSILEVLKEYGVEIYSTGGTEKFIKDAGYTVKSITELTDFPEIMDGRVKTLHPSVHGGFLYRRNNQEHEKQAKENNIAPIDLLILNLYPFEETVSKETADHEEIIENIDIGGPAMLRSAGKNYESVALLTSPSQYDSFIEELHANKGATTYETRLRLASDAFSSVAHYDRVIAEYFERISPDAHQSLFIELPQAGSLRYGENPHQSASVYGEEIGSLYSQLWGKELSYNNYLDSSASLEIISEFLDDDKPVVGIIKHTNPCGIAEGKDVLEAFERAFATDTESPFGGIIVTNKEVTAELAARINEFFSEVVLAPSYSAPALDLLKKKKDRRLLCYDPIVLKKVMSGSGFRSIVGGALLQDINLQLTATDELVSVTSRPVSPEEKDGLLFSWKICKHVKSNAIVYAKTEDNYARTLGIGCGQTSRVASSRLAVASAKRFGHLLEGSLVASDAFFPFADGLVEAADAGAIAVIQPGGSIRDPEVIKAAETRKISLILTGMRHFKH
jgi:phosphoribosylaminoimidazolecarboxamide formyltransferase/IMP cyclohydrolase